MEYSLSINHASSRHCLSRNHMALGSQDVDIVACMEVMRTLPKPHSGDDPAMLQHQPMSH